MKRRKEDIDVLSYYKKRGRYLDTDSILKRFKNGEFSDKCFSILIAERLGFEQLPGLILSIEDGKLTECFLITDDTRTTKFKISDRFHIRYDFRQSFADMYSWLLNRQMRSTPSKICTGDEFRKKIEEFMEKGCCYSKCFRIIAEKIDNCHIFGLATVKGNKVYIEVSDRYEVAHGVNCDAYLVNEKGEIAEYFSTRSSDRKAILSNGALSRIAILARRIYSLIGEGTVVEWGSQHNEILIQAAHRSTKEPFPFLPDDSKAGRLGIRVISQGILEGKIKKLANASPNTLQNLKRNSYVFVCNSPSSDLAVALPYARGFIFEKGSLLCHFALLLREAKIPAIILENASHHLRSINRINTKAAYEQCEK